MTSFLYLYRILEAMAYPLPLVYISKLGNYERTFKTLKKYLGKDKDGELLFLKKFLQDTMKERLESTVDLKFSFIDELEVEEGVKKSIIS